MQVGRQDEGNALQPVHHGYGLWLSGLCDGDKLVREVAVQVKIVAVVAPFVTLYITWEEISANDESSTSFCICNYRWLNMYINSAPPPL